MTADLVAHDTSPRLRLVPVVLLLALAVSVVVAAPVVAERTLGASSGTAGAPAVGGQGPIDVDGPATRRLDPALLDAVRAAALAAQADGIRIEVVSGWRSREHQQQLFDEAVTRYGSEAEARRWVASPEASAHVTGHAVDVGPTDGAFWMSEHGSAYGLCQTFANEIWHYELATTPGGRCPEMYADGSGRG